jgi:hypothetical protein
MVRVMGGWMLGYPHPASRLDPSTVGEGLLDRDDVAAFYRVWLCRDCAVTVTYRA